MPHNTPQITPLQQTPLQQTLQNLPEAPGVYFHKDGEGRVLYIGKAKNLRVRVRSYFQQSATHVPRIRAMVRQIRSIDMMETKSEAEALLLETNLIKKHQPRYNILYKDDKSHPFFKLSLGERYPRLMLTRERKHETHAEYFGPYASVKDAKATLRVLRKHFPLRTSKMSLDGSKTYRPCLNFQMKRCLAPCRGVVEVAEYAQVVRQVRLFLQGKNKELLARLRTEMSTLAEAEHFEKAALKRDAVLAVERTMARQQALTPDTNAEIDVFSMHRERGWAGVQVLFVRHGHWIGSHLWVVEADEAWDDAQVLRSALMRYYLQQGASAAREILVSTPFEDMDLLAETLSTGKKRQVKINHSQRGKRHHLIELASTNAKRGLKERLLGLQSHEAVMQQVQSALHLRYLPQVVEGFDISNIQGTDVVASVVVFRKNQACNAEHRTMNIRSAGQVGEPNDFLAMHEAVTRRFKRKLAENQALPHLVLIDGGKGQVNAAQQALKELGIDANRMDVVGLAKGRSEKRRANTPIHDEDFEYLVKPEWKTTLRFRKNSTTLHFLQRIRDEAHRFALQAHRQRRKQRTLHSDLSHAPGIGKKRRQTLLKHFGSVKRLGQASLEDLLATPSLPQSVAYGLYQYLHPRQKPHSHLHSTQNPL